MQRYKFSTDFFNLKANFFRNIYKPEQKRNYFRIISDKNGFVWKLFPIFACRILKILRNVEKEENIHLVLYWFGIVFLCCQLERNAIWTYDMVYWDRLALAFAFCGSRFRFYM